MARRAGRDAVLASAWLLAAPGATSGWASVAVEAVAIRIQDYADSPPGTLKEAALQAARLLGKAGIETRWLICGPRLPEAPSCGRRPAPCELQLHVLGARHGRSTAPPPSLGFAVVPSNGALGSLAGVFYERVKREAAATLATTSEVLGFAAAHEIAHLLIRSNGHPPHGIMAARLTPNDLDRAAQGRLGFTSQEAERLRGGAWLRQECVAERMGDGVHAGVLDSSGPQP
jgi:hypothetical protein